MPDKQGAAAASPHFLQLSLFETATVAQPDTSSTVAPQNSRLKVPDIGVAPAPQIGAVFRHPNTHREIRLGEHAVGYELRRAKRRSIGFTVSPDGLRVSAPRWVSHGDIEVALREKGSWILRKLHEQRQRAQRVQSARVDWCDGVSIPYLGESIIVVLDPRAAQSPGGAVLNSGEHAAQGLLSEVPHKTLHIGLPQGAQPDQIRDLVQSWLQRQAKQLFEARCQHFASQLHVRVTRLKLSSAQTRWGSASADGTIRLNWRLIHFGAPIIDYVVAHELAHLREMNHSPKFWEVVRSVVPDYERVRGSLRTEQIPIFE